MRGEIRNLEKYLAGKLLDHSAWAEILPRNITPSDGDMIFDNAGKFLFVELKGSTCNWADIAVGQRRLFENLLLALGPASGSVAVLARHREPEHGEQIDTVADVLEFTPMWVSASGFIQVGDPRHDWREYVAEFYRSRVEFPTYRSNKWV